MNAIVYARVSSTTDRQNTQRQVADLTHYAEYKGLDVVKVFEEKISGAKKNSDRAVFIEALKYCKNNNIDFILVSELSRLGRNVYEVLETVKMLIDEKINLYLQKEQITLLDENGKPSIFAPIMIATLGTCAQLERENIKFRLNSGRELAKTKGVKFGRSVGSVEDMKDKKEKYPISLGLLKKGYKNSEIVAIANSRGEKISLATLKRLKKMQG